MVIAIVLGHQWPWQDSTMWKLSNITSLEINANKLLFLIFFFILQPLIWPKAKQWTSLLPNPCRGWWELWMLHFLRMMFIDAQAPSKITVTVCQKKKKHAFCNGHFVMLAKIAKKHNRVAVRNPFCGVFFVNKLRTMVYHSAFEPSWKTL